MNLRGFFSIDGLPRTFHGVRLNKKARIISARDEGKSRADKAYRPGDFQRFFRNFFLMSGQNSVKTFFADCAPTDNATAKI